MTMSTHSCNKPDYHYKVKQLEDAIAWSEIRIKVLEKAYSELHRDTAAMMGDDADRIKVLEDALKDIARQNLESEIHEDYREDADYRGAYDCIIRVARAALEVKPCLDT